LTSRATGSGFVSCRFLCGHAPSGHPPKLIVNADIGRPIPPRSNARRSSPRRLVRMAITRSGTSSAMMSGHIARSWTRVCSGSHRSSRSATPRSARAPWGVCASPRHDSRTPRKMGSIDEESAIHTANKRRESNNHSRPPLRLIMSCKVQCRADAPEDGNRVVFNRNR
jgi:hypothetical protein